MSSPVETKPLSSRNEGTPARRVSSQRIVIRSKFFFQGGEKFFVKGVTYGPFKPIDGIHLPPPDRVRADLRLMAEVGINTLRLYHAPPTWFLDECELAGIKAFITIPWEQHVSFLDTLEMRSAIRDKIWRAVRSNKGHPAIFAYAVGNEIPAPIARWYGSYRVENFIESLVDVARQVDPYPLYTYANYPSTEYLLPGLIDFNCFNVYLHNQAVFQRYLARLQNLAAEKPLMLGEFGMDTMRHPEEEQAELFHWHVEAVARMGLAGTFLFAWTDDWFTGGHQITDWKFGIVDADRKPKKSFYTVQGLFKDAHRIALKHYPKVSVVVCSYNGARTLQACLTSLLQMNYPDYEVILVDDGSTDKTQEIMKDFPQVKNIHQENLGLSVARNVGMKAASGEVIAYTDSDCMADKDWLYYLVGTLQQDNFMAVGGPNISPPAQSWVQACVAVAPGQPSHVLVDDSEAEHIPGCNMAFYKWALESIGGFDPVYRKAGDDVDVCWRLRQQGHRIGFSPSAVVWHHRRFSIRAYFKQQEGYGEAEALLRFKHFVFFGPTGSAKWKGQVYGSIHLSSLFHRPIVYHGVFGMGLFQAIYPRKTSDFVLLMSSLEWSMLTLLTLLVAIQVRGAWYVPAFLFACTVLVGFSYGLRARVEPPYQKFHSHILVSLLAIWQPIARGWARYSTWMIQKRSPRQLLEPQKDVKVVWDRPAVLSFWSENGVGREQFLSSYQERLDEEGWKYSPDTGWSKWDFQIYGNRWWQMRLLTVTEEHGSGKRLTHARLHPNPTTFCRLLAYIASAISLLFLIQYLRTTSSEGYFVIGTWFSLVCLWLCYIFFKSTRLRRRLAQLAEIAAEKCGLLHLAPPS